MSISHSRAHLPDNPTLKEINWYKKQINWGELPPFYHMVAQSLGESEGVLTHGFDNAIKRISDKRNWNLQALGGYIDNSNIIHCENKPRIALHQVFTDRGFELQACCYAKDTQIDQYVKGNKLLDFYIWDPHTMKMVLRINQMHKFVDYYFEYGDDADRALIIHAHKTVMDLIQHLKTVVNVVKVDGTSIAQYYEIQQRKLGSADPDELKLAAIKAGMTEFRK
ncbi:hypothetical protein [Rheinheimera sp.]|uniref:hypothetical protein n=1 Tax=Rheinheimera sp. TaxID=1869214 RepID=UPI00307E2183